MTGLPRAKAGDALTIIGVLHTIFGIFEYRGALQEMEHDRHGIGTGSYWGLL